MVVGRGKGPPAARSDGFEHGITLQQSGDTMLQLIPRFLAYGYLNQSVTPHVGKMLLLCNVVPVEKQADFQLIIL